MNKHFKELVGEACACCFDQEETRCGKKKWFVKDLVDLPGIEFNLNLMSIDLGVMPWDMDNMLEVIRHINDTNNVDFQYPVLLSPSGWVMNGWHRIAKAILDGKRTIRAKRLLELPD